MIPGKIGTKLIVAAALWLQWATWGPAAQPADLPHWIAVDQLPDGGKFSRSVSLPAVQSASLRLAADYCRVQVVINGRPTAQIEPYCQTISLDVTDAFQLGDNQVDMIPEAIAGAPAAIAATLTVKTADGNLLVIPSNESWSAVSVSGHKTPATIAEPVRPELWEFNRRGIAIDPFENYEQWQQAKGGGGTAPRFFVAQGFEVTQLRLASAEEGSWISLGRDHQGRLLIAREDQGFLRMTLDKDARSVLRVEAISSDLLECRGLVFEDNWCYASANNSKSLVRFQPGEDGQIHGLQVLRELAGGVGHGRNDLAVSRESLLLICGDSVDPLTMNFSDRTSPLRHRVAAGNTKEGTLLRTNLDGTGWELLCGGMRNPYGVARHPEYGDAFTYDADNEYDLGMPWYRPTRVLHLIPGADYGYREATGQIPPRFSDQPDAAPPLIDIGRGSPTAVIAGRDFTFPAPYRDAVFVLDWTYGRVIAVHLAPQGATYRAATELFLQGKPLNVTDVVAGPDGAMYLITGGRKTQSALYRVAPVATTAAPTGSELTEFTNREQAQRAYSSFQSGIARQLQGEAVQGRFWTQEDLIGLLDDPDPIVRYGARNSLERSPDASWAMRILDQPAGSASLRGLMAVARLLDGSLVDSLTNHLLAVSPRELRIDQRLVWLRTLELCHSANPDVVRSKKEQLSEAIISGWDACLSPPAQISVEGSASLYRRRGALLLAVLGCPRLPELAARDLLAGGVQEDQISALMALRNQQVTYSPDAREAQLQALAAMPSMIGGEGLPNFHAWLERETLATLSPQEQVRYERMKRANALPEPLPPPRPVVQKWTLDDLISLAADANQGDKSRGEKIFREALCSRCHRFGNRGPYVGPDLTFVAGRFSRRDILDSIVNPSKSVAENYRSTTIQTIDGQVITGRVMPGGDFRSERIKLVPDSLHPDQVVEIEKKTIEVHEPSERSPMPQGLLDILTREEIADLLAYLTGR